MKILYPEWIAALKAIDLYDFDVVWKMPLDRVDEPNQARGGWSEVCRYDLPEPILGVDALYVKRQQDFSYREWPDILSSKPTFQREYRNLVWCLDHDIPVVKPLAYSDKKNDGHQRAILITAGLTKFWPLSEIEQWGALSSGQRKDLLKSIAQLVFKMHSRGLQHACLYPKHIFIHNDYFTSGHKEVRLIDLEKARPLSRWNGGMFRDLDSLNRRAISWTEAERLTFFDEYYAWNDNNKSALLARLRKSLARWNTSGG